jgi:hypothetical protein
MTSTVPTMSAMAIRRNPKTFFMCHSSLRAHIIAPNVLATQRRLREGVVASPSNQLSVTNEPVSIVFEQTCHSDRRNLVIAIMLVIFNRIRNAPDRSAGIVRHEQRAIFCNCKRSRAAPDLRTLLAR